MRVPVHGPAQTGATTTISLPWHLWKVRPVAGDLVLVLSSRPMSSVPPAWTWITDRSAHVTFYPGLPDPAFSAEDSAEWSVTGFIVYPDDSAIHGNKTSTTGVDTDASLELPEETE